jgi:hypothetical protein
MFLVISSVQSGFTRNYKQENRYTYNKYLWAINAHLQANVAVFIRIHMPIQKKMFTNVL